MQITWYGQSCFKITTGEANILITPFDKSTGLNSPKNKADIVLLSADSLKDSSEGFVISGPGEYEIKGVMIQAFSFFSASENSRQATPEKGKPKESMVYAFTAEGISVCHVGQVSKANIVSILDKIGDVDVLLIPVGGPYKEGKEEVHFLNAEEAVALAGELEPRIIIPMQYKIPKLVYAIEGVAVFLKAMGATDAETVDKLSLKKKDLPPAGGEARKGRQEETKVIVVSPNQS